MKSRTIMDVRKLVLSRPAFTLIEVIVVVGIIALLIALVLPAVQMARESARRTNCMNNQKQLALSLHNNESAIRFLPPTISSEHNSSLMFWQAQVLPFLEQESILEAALQEMRNGVTILRNSKRRTTIPVLQCPSNPDLGLLVNPDLGALFAFTDYCGVAGSDRDNGVFALDLRKPRTFFSEVTGGLSNTLLFGERPPSDLDEGFGPWLGGQGAWSASTYTNGTRGLFPISGASQVNLLAACDGRTNLGFQRGERGTRCPTHHWSFHPGGTVFAKADGSVAFLSYATDRTVLADLASRD